MITVDQFYAEQKQLEASHNLSGCLLNAFVLKPGFSEFLITTNSALQKSTGYLSRGSLLLAMCSPDYAVVLRVRDIAESPLHSTESMTNFELSKRGGPELDPFTKADMGWFCLLCDVLGTYYKKDGIVCYAGDLHTLAPAMEYRVYPISALESLVINSQYADDPHNLCILRAVEYTPDHTGQLVSYANISKLGTYQPSEVHTTTSATPVLMYLPDLINHRMALFGKTRSGKSNALKVIVAGLINYNHAHNNLGQLIVDINGEYAHSNQQDTSCLADCFPSDCIVYCVNPVNCSTTSHILRCNFYRCPNQAIDIFRDGLGSNASTYVKAFLSAIFPTLEEIKAMPPDGNRIRAIRRNQLFWLVLLIAGFDCDEADLARFAPRINQSSSVFDPCFSEKVRNAIYDNNVPPKPTTLSEMYDEYEALKNYMAANPKAKLNSSSSSGKALLSPDDISILNFAFPSGAGSGPKVLSNFRNLHHSNSGDYLNEIIGYLDDHKTVILDLSNATPALTGFFSKQIFTAVFHHQEGLFTRNKLQGHNILLYCEEAHNYFPTNSSDNTNIFARTAKEGAKYALGLVYSTQSPLSISSDLLGQTENFLVFHMDSKQELDTLIRHSYTFEGIAPILLRTHTPGYGYLLTASQRYAVPVQIDRFNGKGRQ